MDHVDSDLQEANTVFSVTFAALKQGSKIRNLINKRKVNLIFHNEMMKNKRTRTTVTKIVDVWMIDFGFPAKLRAFERIV